MCPLVWPVKIEITQSIKRSNVCALFVATTLYSTRSHPTISGSKSVFDSKKLFPTVLMGAALVVCAKIKDLFN